MKNALLVICVIILFSISLGQVIDQLTGRADRNPASYEFNSSNLFEALLADYTEDPVRQQIARQLTTEQLRNMQGEAIRKVPRLLTTNQLLKEIYRRPISEDDWKILEPLLAPPSNTDQKQDTINKKVLQNLIEQKLRKKVSVFETIRPLFINYIWPFLLFVCGLILKNLIDYHCKQTFKWRIE